MVNTSGIISTIAGGGINTGDGSPATDAELRDPCSIVFDKYGNLYIVEESSCIVRKVDPSGLITTICGTREDCGYYGDGGPAVMAFLNSPIGIAIDGSGNIYVSDLGNECIRKIDTANIITTYAGTRTAGFSGDGGAATLAQLNGCGNIAVDANGNLFFPDAANNRIRMVNSSGIITTIAGTVGQGYNGDNRPATSAYLFLPSSVSVDQNNNLYISDSYNERIRYIKSTLSVNTITDETDNVNVFPDPSNGKFNLNIISSEDEPITIVISNVIGEKIREMSGMTNKNTEINIDEPSGIYLISADAGNKKWRKEIIVSR